MNRATIKLTIFFTMFVISGILMDPPDFSIDPSRTVTQAIVLPNSSDSICLYVDEGGLINPAIYLVTYKSFEDKKEKLLIFSSRSPAFRSIELRSDGLILVDNGRSNPSRHFFQFSEILNLANYPLYYYDGKGERVSESESNERRNGLNSLLGWILLIVSVVGLVTVIYQGWKMEEQD